MPAERGGKDQGEDRQKKEKKSKRARAGSLAIIVE